MRKFVRAAVRATDFAYGVVLIVAGVAVIVGGSTGVLWL